MINDIGKHFIGHLVVVEHGFVLRREEHLGDDALKHQTFVDVYKRQGMTSFEDYFASLTALVK